MTVWTIDRVLALAPDSGSASAGQSLAVERHWTSLGTSDRAAWGLCQGSGKEPYHTRVDLDEPAFKCSCPSRKFPCKHALALLLLFAEASARFTAGAEPEWVRAWLDGRAERSENKAAKVKASAEAPVDVAAQAKRAAIRDDRVRQGVAECRTWLDDLVRRGLAAAQGNAHAECERVAARMVDAQAPGLAGMVRRIARTMSSGAGWEVRTLEHLGRVHLLLEAAGRMGELPEELAGDVRAALGYSQPKEVVLAQQGVADVWAVVGQSHEDDGRLTVRRTWLWGTRTARAALVLDFSVAGQPFDASLVPGVAFDGEVAYYPSGAPLRGLVKSRGAALQLAELPEGEGPNVIGANLERYARALGANPWLTLWPMVLPRTRVVRSGDLWLLGHGQEMLPLSPAFARGIHLWRLLSVTGGDEATIVAEWDGDVADPVGVIVHAGGTRFVGFVARWAA